MKNLRDRVGRLERLLDDHLKRNPPKIDIHSLTDEARRSLIEFGALLCEIRDIAKIAGKSFRLWHDAFGATNGFKSVAVEQDHKRERAAPCGSDEIGLSA